MSRNSVLAALLVGSALTLPAASAFATTSGQRAQATEGVDARAKMVQEMVDSIFSFAEPGFQEVRTSAYITGVLEKNGFTVTRGVSGIPTAWTATWGDGGPLIALGSDIDGLLGLSQFPGSPQIKPMVEGAPGHGEGHNSGMPVVVAAALAAKDVMEKNNIKGRLMIWPGVAEELLGSKAFYVRDGVFKGVDANIFTHVSNDFNVGWGDMGNTGMVSVEYRFHGKTSHAAGAPWLGLSALDGVELMNIAWNMRREHLPVTQRSHYVITNGGGQPNVVPGEASVWYYFRERTFDGVRKLYELGNEISEATAKGTGTTVTRQVYGHAAVNHGNRPLAEAMYANIRRVGMPKWSAEDQQFAKQVQEANGFTLKPLASDIPPISTPESRGGGVNASSDDIGDVMWTVPTITLRFPSNIPNTSAHHVTAAIGMTTPIAHKGAVVGARALALTILDIATTPTLVTAAKDYFTNVQTKDQKYDPVLAATDKPPIHLNKDLMTILRPQMEKFYYDPSKHQTYLEQLGISYPAK